MKGHELALGKRFGRLLNVRGREWGLLGLMLGHFALAMLTMTLLQSAHLGLLLNAFGREALPVYFLAKGGFLFLISLYYSVRVIGRVSRQAEILSFLGLVVALLLGTRALMLGQGPWLALVYLALSVFAEVFVSMFTLQCWGLYSDCMDSRQSKRLMPLIGAGGTAGAMLGGGLASLLARPMGAENLLLVCFFFVSCVGLLSVRLLTGHLGESGNQAGVASLPPAGTLWHETKAIFDQIFRHRLLLQFMLLIMSVKLGSNLAEYQQQVLLRESLDKDAISAFVGTWLALTYLVALIFQTLFENRLLQRFGPLFGLATTPICVGFAAGGFLLSPTLMTTAIGRGAEQLTNKSIYKTSVNLVYLAFPSELRRRMRVVINGLLEFFAILPFALITLLLPALPLQGYAIGAIVASILALGLVFALRQPYQAQLQSALLSRPLRLEDREDPFYSPRSYAQLAETSLASGEPSRLRFGLELLQQRNLSLAPELIEPLLMHHEAGIRRLAVETLARYGGPEQNPVLLGLLAREPDVSVRRSAVRTLGTWVDERSNEALSVWLQDPDLGVRAETLVVLFLRGGIEGILIAGRYLKRLLASEDPAELRAAARVIGEIGTNYFRKDLLRLLEHADAGVELAAIEATGRSPDKAWIAPLIARLGDRSRAVVRQARQSLQRYPSELLLPAVEAAYTHDEAMQGVEGDIARRSELIRVLEACPGPATLHLLLSWLQRADWRLKHPILRVLGALQAERPGQLNEHVLYLETQSVLREAYACVELLWLLRHQREERLSLLTAELALWLRYTQDLLFRLLGLLYEPEQIAQAALNYASGDANYRALSLDLLAQMLGRSLGPPVLNLLEDAPLEKKVHFAQASALLAERHDKQWWDRPLIQDHRLLRQLAVWCRYTGDNPSQAGSMLDTIYLLKQTPLFANLGLEQLEPVARVCRPESRPAGEVILSEGAPGQTLYIVKSGRVAVEAGGRTLATLGPKEVFGEVEILHAAPNLATIRSLEPCELLAISRQDFSDLIEDYPAFAKGLVEILFERLRAAFERAREPETREGALA